jgi:peptidoglycan/LPS O-acetylase OafA/YrhL
MVAGHIGGLDGVRAFAVLTVILFHLWPNRLPGGFLGVDVFFVISGYLIASCCWRSGVSKATSTSRPSGWDAPADCSQRCTSTNPFMGL